MDKLCAGAIVGLWAAVLAVAAQGATVFSQSVIPQAVIPQAVTPLAVFPPVMPPQAITPQAETPSQTVAAPTQTVVSPAQAAPLARIMVPQAMGVVEQPIQATPLVTSISGAVYEGAGALAVGEEQVVVAPSPAGEAAGVRDAGPQWEPKGPALAYAKTLPLPVPVARGVYIIKKGAHLAVVAQRTGTNVVDVIRLNPRLSPQALLPAGTRVALPVTGSW